MTQQEALEILKSHLKKIGLKFKPIDIHYKYIKGENSRIFPHYKNRWEISYGIEIIECGKKDRDVMITYVTDPDGEVYIRPSL